MKSYGARAVYILAMLLAAFALIGCASQQAALMAAKAQSELAIYVSNANGKVHQAEDARLELELRLLELDISNLIKLGIATPERTSKEIVAKVKQHIDARDDRLQIWNTANISASNASILLGSIEQYNKIGINAQQGITVIEGFQLPAKPVKGTATNGPIP